MIVSKISSGLGNQLFQYAFGIYISKINKTEHKVDISGYKDVAPDPKLGIRICGLDHFNITSKYATVDDLREFNFLVHNRFFRRLIRFYSLKNNYYKRKYIIEPENNYFHFDPKVLEYRQEGNVYIEGYWQSEKYFKGVEDIVRKELTFKNKPNKINSETIKQIESSNSICIHIRHGDNVNMENGVLPLDYYYRAVDKISERVTNPVFYIFSDDPDWVKENLKLEHSTVYVSHNDAENCHEDLRLMTHCKHHIIGNSTFSWWGAWLGKKENQIVFSPRSNHSYQDLPSSDHIPEEWNFI